MKKFKFNKVSKIILAFVLTLGFVGLNSAQAVTPPDRGLGLADSYSVFGKAGVTTTGVTHVWGNAGADSSVGLISSQVDGSIYTGAGVAGVETDARSTYDSLMSATQGTPTALDLAGTHTIANGNPITPGVYTVGATTLNGAVELSGAGVYIFRSTSSVTIANGGTMALRNGADACNVFWAVQNAMTIGTSAQMIGTIIAHDGLISLNTGANLIGRAISLIAQVTLNANLITQPICAAPATTVRRSSGSIPRVVVPVFQPTINIISTPVVVAPIIPMLPKTGFAPQEVTWYQSLLNNILNLFR